jgi:hypothetical protein
MKAQNKKRGIVIMSVFKTIKHQVDLCVVGGGLAGICTAVSAARNGIKVAIMQDRPMFGGNASSEIRMWIGGASARKDYLKEGGLIEELDLENCYRNPYKNYSIWDSIMYQLLKYEKNVEIILNCSCLDATINNDKIESIKGWQTTTQQFHEVFAGIFADCSGDSILAPLTNAEFRIGRESKCEFNEEIGHEEADCKTMGMSCLIQARECKEKRMFIPPFWSEKFTEEKLLCRNLDLSDIFENFWWIEIGGTQNTIDDTEKLRDELFEITYGVFDYIKNSGKCNADNWELDWIGGLPGKRESRRYVGDYILTQNDATDGCRFDDIVAYGGWAMDDHYPEGLRRNGEPARYFLTAEPYGIPYRCLYSKNIQNLMFAGRNISATHAAMSSSRVMATCAVLGQAVGTACAIAIKNQTTPRGVYEKHIKQLQQTLMNDDCFLPYLKKEITKLTKNAKVFTDGRDVENLWNGIERKIDGDDNGWYGNCGSFIELSYDELQYIQAIRIVFDSNFERVHIGNYHHNMDGNIHLNRADLIPPDTLVKEFKVEILNEDEIWEIVIYVNNNYQRLVKKAIDKKATKVRFTPLTTWGKDEVHIFGLELF